MFLQLLLSKNFLSVKKTKDVTWDELRPMVISHLNDYFEKNNEPILKENKIQPNKSSNKKDKLEYLLSAIYKIKNVHSCRRWRSQWF